MKPTSKTLSWAFVIILLAVGIFTGLGVILMHKQRHSCKYPWLIFVV